MGQNLAARTRQQQVARRDDNAPAMNAAPLTISQVITRMQPEIARALPKHLDADRMARLALTAVRKNPKLAECTPESFAGALLTAAALGLEPGVNDECYLVPYRDKSRGMECQLIVGYQGLSKQYFQSPLAAYLDAQAVFEGDDFDYAYGTDPFLRHKPKKGGDRGAVTDYYAVAKLTTGATRFVVLSPEEVKELRRGKVGPSGDIPDPQRWMERKTALRQLLKLLPKSPSLAQTLRADERSGRELFRERMDDRAVEAGNAPAAIETSSPAAALEVYPEPDEAPPAPPSPDQVEVELITDAQVKELNAALGKAGYSSAADRLEWLRSALFNPELKRIDDLSREQAIDALAVLAGDAK